MAPAPRRPGEGLGRAFFHLLPQAQRTHVSPDLLDVGEALGLRARLAGVAPAERVLAVGRQMEYCSLWLTTTL